MKPQLLYDAMCQWALEEGTIEGTCLCCFASCKGHEIFAVVVSLSRSISPT